MSERISSELQRLDDFLCRDVVDDEAMLLSELDGFLAGVIVCPDLIPPSEWLPLVWGEEGPEFESEQEAQSILGLIMGHYNDIIRQLDGSEYLPVYEMDIDDSFLWEIWIDGFWQALRLRPEAWRAFAQAHEQDEDFQRSLFVLGRLGELADGPGDLEPIEIDEELEALAPDLIPIHVEILHRARLAGANRFATAANENCPKVGRNDPCPCGSGKKFKKCCLN
jgi:uncharacterized protein